MPSRSKTQQRLFGLVRKCQKTGECASPEISKIADSIGEKDAEDFAKTKHKGLPNKVKKKKFKESIEMNNKEFAASVRQKYAPSVPQIDRDRYTDIEGLEGPFMLRSGKVVYYDPKEGKYYDRDRDMYMSDDEYHAHSNPRTESVNFHRFWEILEENKS